MVKWIHIADVHLGASPDAGDAYSKVRPQELWDTFAEVSDICEREQTDLLLIAGDLFHRQPLKKELKEVIERLSKKMNQAAAELNFELAAQLRDELKEFKIAYQEYDD